MKPARIRTAFRTASTRSMSMRRAWYTEAVPEKPDTPAVTPPETPQGNNGGTPDVKFTQADLDKYAGNARTEARAAAQKKILEDLGVDNLDSLKTVLADVKKRQDAELSETQKLQAQIDTANKKALEAEQRAKDTEAKYINEQRRNVFESTVGGNNPKRVYALIQLEKPADFAAVFGDDAAPDDAKLKALIKQVQSDYPEYFGSPGAGSPSNAGGMAPTVQKATEDAKKDIEKKFGKL